MIGICYVFQKMLIPPRWLHMQFTVAFTSQERLIASTQIQYHKHGAIHRQMTSLPYQIKVMSKMISLWYPTNNYHY